MYIGRSIGEEVAKEVHLKNN